MTALTAAEIAAFLGVTPAAVRQIVSRKGIQANGKVGRAKTYDPLEVLRHAGTHDRRSTTTGPEGVSH